MKSQEEGQGEGHPGDNILLFPVRCVFGRLPVNIATTYDLREAYRSIDTG
jgi:hypothetical protein